MRKADVWIPIAILTAVVIGIGGLFAYRLGTANRQLAFALESERQRNFSEMVYHVEQIQARLSKGLVVGTVGQNMRFMADVHEHTVAAVANFSTLPLPAELNANSGKFLQQTGDVAVSILRNEAAGRPMDETQRAMLATLRDQSRGLSDSLHQIAQKYNQGGTRWVQPTGLSWATLWRGTSVPSKPNTGEQSPASIMDAGLQKVGADLEKLPVLIYDGPFSEHVAKRTPATAGAPIDQAAAEQRVRSYLPNMGAFRVEQVISAGGVMPTYSFRLAPASAPKGSYTTTVDVTKNGGDLAQLLNGRMIGQPTIKLEQAQAIAQKYLNANGFTGLIPTYSQTAHGAATIAFAFKTDDVIIYPDQIKVKVALDNGEIIGVDARQYLMSHHPRTFSTPAISTEVAQAKLNPRLSVLRGQLALIPDLAGTGEILTYEFVTTLNNETYLVYLNANTGAEEQILQQVTTDGGLFTM